MYIYIYIYIYTLIAQWMLEFSAAKKNLRIMSGIEKGFLDHLVPNGLPCILVLEFECFKSGKSVMCGGRLFLLPSCVEGASYSYWLMWLSSHSFLFCRGDCRQFLVIWGPDVCIILDLSPPLFLQPYLCLCPLLCWIPGIHKDKIIVLCQRLVRRACGIGR